MRARLLKLGAVVVVALAAPVGVQAAGAVQGGGASPQVIGGADASTDQYPWVVALQASIGGGTNGQFCGGTLVAPTKVVTAAHCVVETGLSAADITVVQGRTDLRDRSAGTEVGVAETWVHPNYFDVTEGADVAVLTLARGLTTPTLPVAGTDTDAQLLAPDTDALVLGWGRTSSGGSTAAVLQKATLPVRSDQTCRDVAFGLGVAYSETAMTCAGYPQGTPSSSCQGDSGGPLVVDGTLVGVVSWGRTGCLDISYFARVSTYSTLIAAQVGGTGGY